MKLINKKINGLKILKTQNLKLHLMRGSINTVSLILWFTALGIVPLAKATALGFTSPLFVTILAVIFLDAPKSSQSYPYFDFGVVSD